MKLITDFPVTLGLVLRAVIMC